MIFKSSFLSITKWEIAKIIMAVLSALVCCYTLKIAVGILSDTNDNLKYDIVTNYDGIIQNEKISGTINDLPICFTIGTHNFYAIKTDSGKYLAFSPTNGYDPAAFEDQYIRYTSNRNYYRLEYNATVAKMDDNVYRNVFRMVLLKCGEDFDCDSYFDGEGGLLPFNEMKNTDYARINNMILPYMIEVEDSVQKPGVQATFAFFGTALFFFAVTILLLRKTLVKLTKVLLYHLGLYRVEVKTEPDEPLDDGKFTDHFNEENYFFDDKINERPYVRSMPEDAPKYEADDFYTGEVSESGFFYVGTESENKLSFDEKKEGGSNDENDDESYRHLRY